MRAPPPVDGDLRWLPRHPHPCGYVGPVLLALVTDVVMAERRLTLHRTWLAADGTGKAPIDRPRLLWPGLPKTGGVVRLWPDAEVTMGLCIAEGIESALAAARGFVPVWACLDAANLAAFPVLAGLDALTIVADHDRPNPRNGRRAGIEAADACARRWSEAGRDVRVWVSPVEGEDANDFAARAA